VVAQDTPENLSRAMRGGERLVLEVERLAPAIAERLQAVPGVVDVSLLGSESVDAAVEVSRFLVQSAPGDESAARRVRRSLAAAVADAGGGLLELRAERLTLEDIFVRLVTEEGSAQHAARSTQQDGDAA
jgi:ABC-2 type transport system ATP-binding protein